MISVHINQRSKIIVDVVARPSHRAGVTLVECCGAKESHKRERFGLGQEEAHPQSGRGKDQLQNLQIIVKISGFPIQVEII